jgi:hypothetical protein
MRQQRCSLRVTLVSAPVCYGMTAHHDSVMLLQTFGQNRHTTHKWSQPAVTVSLVTVTANGSNEPSPLTPVRSEHAYGLMTDGRPLRKLRSSQSLCQRCLFQTGPPLAMMPCISQAAHNITRYEKTSLVQCCTAAERIWPWHSSACSKHTATLAHQSHLDIDHLLPGKSDSSSSQVNTHTLAQRDGQFSVQCSSQHNHQTMKTSTPQHLSIYTKTLLQQPFKCTADGACKFANNASLLPSRQPPTRYTNTPTAANQQKRENQFANLA